MHNVPTVVYKRSDNYTCDWTTNVFLALSMGVGRLDPSVDSPMLYVGVLKDASDLLPVNPPCKSSRTYHVNPKRDLTCLRSASEAEKRILLEMYEQDAVFNPAVLDEQNAINRVRGIFPNEYGSI